MKLVNSDEDSTDDDDKNECLKLDKDEEVVVRTSENVINDISKQEKEKDAILPINVEFNKKITDDHQQQQRDISKSPKATNSPQDIGILYVPKIIGTYQLTFISNIF